MYSHIDKLSKINNLMKIKYSLNSILMYYNNIEKKKLHMLYKKKLQKKNNEYPSFTIQ